jgi:sugar phosphate permease
MIFARQGCLRLLEIRRDVSLDVHKRSEAGMAEGELVGEAAGGSAVSAVPLPSATSQTGEDVYAKVTWRIVPLLCLGFLIAYIDRANVGFAKLQMLDDLAFSDSVFGLGSGLFFISYIAFEVPSNIALKHIGAKIWLSRIMVTWGVLSALMMFCRTPTYFYVARFLLGIAEAGFFPGALFYLSTWFPMQRRSRITALFMLAIPLSGMIGAPLSGWIMTRFQGLAGLAGWQWLFLIEALPAIGLGAVVFLALPASIGEAKWLTAGEKSSLERDLEADRRHDDVHSILNALKDGRVWLIGVIDVAILLGMYSIIFWLPTIVRGAGLANLQSNGLVTAIPHLAGIIAMIVIGWHSDRSRERRWHVALPMLVGAAALAASTLFTGDVALTILAFAVANAGVVGAVPVLLSIPSGFLRGGAAAAGLALISSIGNLAGFFSTYLTGRIVDATHSASAALVVFAVCLALGALIALSLPARLVDR